MVRRLFHRVLLRPSDLPPSCADFEVIGAFNPAATLVDGQVVLLVRVAERPRQRSSRFTGLPRYCPERGVVIDWVAKRLLDLRDPRIARFKRTGLIRLPFISHLRLVYCG